MKTIAVQSVEGEEPKLCNSLDELDHLLDELHLSAIERGDFVTVSIINHAEDEIVTAIGKDFSGLCLQIAPRDGEYYTSLGNKPPGDGLMSYGVYQDSYWDSESLLPIAVVRETIRYFAEHGRRDPRVRWQDWNGKETSA